MTLRMFWMPALAAALAACAAQNADPLAAAREAYAAQDHSAARDLAQAALAEDPHDGAALELLARTQLAMGQGGDALATLARMADAGTLPEDARLIEAEARLQTGDAALVEGLLRRQDSAESWRLRALAAATRGDDTGALAAFARGRDAVGEKHRLFAAEANFHLARGNAAAAREAVARAQRAAPHSIETLFVSARLAQISGEHELAARAYLAILDIAPADRPALLGAIAELRHAGRSDLLPPLVQRGREIYPGDIAFLQLAARLLADEGNWRGARDLLQQREAAIADHAEARQLYGQALLELGQVELARAQIAPLYRRDPGDADIARIYAGILLSSGEAAEAARVIAPIAALPDALPTDRELAQRAAAAGAAG